MKLAVLGCGNMGSAIVAGLLKSSSLLTSCIIFDKNPARKGSFNDQRVTYCENMNDFAASIETVDVVLVAVKPQDFISSINSLYAKATNNCNPLWVSVAAGLSLEKISEALPKGSRICRVMPNTPSLIGEGVSGYSLNEYAHEDDEAKIVDIFSTCGTVLPVPEKSINAVTGVSGSGPAYVFLFIEALIEGGITAGLSYDQAYECAVNTVIGAGKLLKESGDTCPSMLKSKVMSPGGTTAYGLLALEEGGVKASVIKAVLASKQRADELN